MGDECKQEAACPLMENIQLHRCGEHIPVQAGYIFVGFLAEQRRERYYIYKAIEFDVNDEPISTWIMDGSDQTLMSSRFAKTYYADKDEENIADDILPCKEQILLLMLNQHPWKSDAFTLSFTQDGKSYIMKGFYARNQYLAFKGLLTLLYQMLP